MKLWTMMTKALKSPALIKDYFEGQGRLKLYNSWFSFLISRHIREQYKYRLVHMNPTCYDEGACIKCGCTTPALQFANKSCDAECYPPFMNRKQWKQFKKYDRVFLEETSHDFWIRSMMTDRPIKGTMEDGKFVLHYKVTDNEISDN